MAARNETPVERSSFSIADLRLYTDGRACARKVVVIGGGENVVGNAREAKMFSSAAIPQRVVGEVDRGEALVSTLNPVASWSTVSPVAQLSI